MLKEVVTSYEAYIDKKKKCQKQLIDLEISLPFSKVIKVFKSRQMVSLNVSKSRCLGITFSNLSRGFRSLSPIFKARKCHRNQQPIFKRDL